MHLIFELGTGTIWVQDGTGYTDTGTRSTRT